MSSSRRLIVSVQPQRNSSKLNLFYLFGSSLSKTALKTHNSGVMKWISSVLDDYMKRYSTTTEEIRPKPPHAVTEDITIAACVTALLVSDADDI